jgi:hypothetical protein
MAAEWEPERHCPNWTWLPDGASSIVEKRRHRELVWRKLQVWQGFLTDALLRWRVSSIKGCRMGARKALSKLNLTTGWWVKGCQETTAQGTCVEKLAGMARIFGWCTTQVESVQYKRLQNGSQKGTIQTETWLPDGVSRVVEKWLHTGC